MRSRGRGRVTGVIGDDTVVSRSVAETLQLACRSGTLKLVNRSLLQVPAELFRLSNVEYGDKKWWLEEELKTLDLGNNDIQVLPEQLKCFSASLRVLLVPYNKLRHVLVDLGSFSLLGKLDLSHNMLEGSVTAALCGGSVSAGRLNLPLLKECDLSYNELVSAAGLAGLPSLTHLNISHNRLRNIEPDEVVSSGPPARSFFASLQHLDLSSNCLVDLPPLFNGSRDLQVLDASHNNITHLHSSSSLSPSLVTLNLRHNALDSLPSHLHLPKLKELIIGFNRFRQLPDFAAADASQIAFLDASNNQLCSVDAVVALTQLTRLDISNNSVTSLPPRLALIRTLNSVVVDGNPLRCIRREVVAKGTVALLTYLRSRLDVGENDDLAPNPEASLAAMQAALPGPGSTNGPKPLLVMLGERNGATWDLSGARRMLPEELSLALIEAAAPATLSVVRGISSWVLAGQKNLLRIDPSVTAVLCDTLKDVDASNTPISSLDFVFSLPPTSHVGSSPAPNLTALTAAGCKLSGSFVDRWCSATNLVRLDLSRNALSDLHPLFATMAALKYLNLNQNNFRLFPLVIYRLPGLVELQLASNGLSELPEGAHEAWPSMQLLDLSSNDLQTIPLSLGLMHGTLRSIKLEGNRIRWLRQSVLEKGTGRVLEYLRQKMPSS